MKRFSVSALIYGILLSTNASAMPTFPNEIQSHLHLSYAPQCTLCHGSISGGGPVVQPFGESMLAAGLTVSGGSTLTNALDKLDQDKTDSDGDGAPDIDELKLGTSPNPDKAPLQYGCGAKIAPGGLMGWKAPIFALLAFAIFARRSKSGRDSGTLS